ncbi:unnamed protein product, partial [Heterosigma akashiwo]
NTYYHIPAALLLLDEGRASSFSSSPLVLMNLTHLCQSHHEGMMSKHTKLPTSSAFSSSPIKSFIIMAILTTEASSEKLVANKTFATSSSDLLISRKWDNNNNIL